MSQDRNKANQIPFAVALSMVAAILSTVAWWTSDGAHPPKTISFQPREVATPETLFDQNIDPVIDAQKVRSRETMELCVSRIRDRFREYRRGIPAFAEDLTSTWTRLGVLRRMPIDWWKEDGRVEEYVQSKFEKHLFSEEKLTSDIAKAFEQLQEDLRADRAHLLASVKIAISEGELPDIELPESTEFDSSVQEKLQQFAATRATDSVYHGVSSLIASDVAMTVAAGLVTRVVTAMGTAAATSSAAAGGATAGSAAAGAGGGSAAGPAGTAIGLGIGLVVGVAVDWWMTAKFRDQLETEMESYLFRLEHSLVFGSHEAGAPESDGLQVELNKLLEDITLAQREVLYAKFMKGQVQ